jgi:hypothetical protein
MIIRMVQYDGKPAAKVRKRKREVMPDRPLEEMPTAEESFLICDDCKHSSIRYDPAKDGACDCGCH